MPYITKTRRAAVSSFDSFDHPANAGELTYAITKLICDYLMQHEVRYETMAQVLGALSGAKLEFYRRVVTPYEDRKIRENGDVYPPAVLRS
jgi:uncharacterized protein DUF6899